MKNTRVLLPALLLLALAQQALAQSAVNWPQWRGPNRDGISKETGLLKQWPAEGPPLVWKASGAGGGYSSFSVANDKLYTMGLRGDREFVIAQIARDQLAGLLVVLDDQDVLRAMGHD